MEQDDNQPEQTAGEGRSPQRTFKTTIIPAGTGKPPVSFVPRSPYVPGFSSKAASRACPRCGFLAFGWSKECSKCAAPLDLPRT